jgi:2-dehydro-3-deoxyphosphooctonate aldolase (KDO 8-P synthase)
LLPNAHVTAGNVTFGNDLPLALIAGPCQLESRDHAFMMAGALKDMALKLGIGLIYKTSYDKANRTSIKGKRGLGLEKSLQIFADLKSEFDLPVDRRSHRRTL